jgi:hypothetical protein
MSAFPLPTPEGGAKMLSDLLGRDVTVSEGPAISLSAQPLVMVSSFTDKDRQIAMACICDISFASYAGAALSMIPAAGAKDCISNGTLTEAISENFYEVMNITSLIFNDQGAPRLILREMHSVPGTSLPDDLTALIASPGGKISFRIGIAGYGEGGMTILLANVR